LPADPNTARAHDRPSRLETERLAGYPDVRLFRAAVAATAAAELLRAREDPVAHAGPVRGRQAGLEPEANRLLRLHRDIRGPDEHLGRDASGVQTSAPEPFAVVEEGDGEPCQLRTD